MKAGITVDNYKVPLFEKEFSAAGFKFDKFPFTKDTTVLRVECEQSQLGQIKDLCTRLHSISVRKKAKDN